MKRLAATWGPVLLLAGCHPAQQAFDPTQSAYRGSESYATAAPTGVQASWERFDRSPVWPASNTLASATGGPAPAPTPPPGSSLASTYTAGASAPTSSAAFRSSIGNPQFATASALPVPRPGLANLADRPAPGTQPGASSAGMSGLQVARADLTPPEMPALKVPAKPGPSPALPDPAATAGSAMPPLPAIPPLPLPPPLDSPRAAKDAVPACKDKDVIVPVVATMPAPKNTNVVHLSPLPKDEKSLTLSTLPAAGDGPCHEKVHTTAKMSAHAGAPSVRMVNSKRIQFNYKVEDVGPSGIGGVELWYTMDGRGWQKFDGAKAGPPCIAEVADEGTYGFTLVAKSGTGFGKEPPKAGDLPQVWVEVDLTAPKVALLDVKSASSTQSNLNIQWSASDRNLARRPITLSYAEKPAGPWTVIAANLENTGKYAWSMPSTLPVKFLVKVEAADLVGNVGSVQSKEPILFDLSQPVVQLQSVEPATK